MSTFYYFYCKKCKVCGGWMSRQAWGAGNFDIVSTFKFVMYHGMNCGTHEIGFISEHDQEFFDFPDETMVCDDLELFEKFVEKTKTIFPRSDDWALYESGDSAAAWNQNWLNKQIEIINKEKEISIKEKQPKRFTFKHQKDFWKYQFNELEELLNIGYFIRLINDKNFYRFSYIDNVIIWELKEGQEWYVIGYINNIEELGLPKWELKK